MTAPDPRPDIRLLADLDAGLLDEARAREVRAAAAADPAAQAVLDALATTRAELAALPDPSVPPAVAARWSAALAEEARITPRRPPTHPAPTDSVAAHLTVTPAAPHTPAPADPSNPGPAESSTSHPTRAPRTPPAGCEETEAVRRSGPPPTPTTPPSPPDDRPRPKGPPYPQRHPSRAPRTRHNDPARPATSRRSAARRLLRRPAVLAAALLVAVAAVAALRARPEPPPTIGKPQLVAEAISAVGIHDAAGLDDPTRRAGCLRALGRPADAPLLGGRRVTFEGNPGVLLVLGTGQRGTFDVLIVDPDCGPERGTLLDAAHVAPP
ncbi:MAG: hypothetical protein JOY78_01005 [Pseudonocardia sp.]|nr:hypothetical protein [Pseudonocardia sp.]